jgi:hypothetical protein
MGEGLCGGKKVDRAAARLARSFAGLIACDDNGNPLDEHYEI